MNTPNYIKALVMPNAQKPQGRRVWNIDLKDVWIPFFMATNTQGDTAIPSAELGHPIQLGIDKNTGEVRFSKSGKPIYRVSKSISDGVKMVRDNQVAGMLAFVGQVAEDNPDGYAEQVRLAEKMGTPLANHDNDMLREAMELRALVESEQSDADADSAKGTKEAVLVS